MIDIHQKHIWPLGKTPLTGVAGGGGGAVGTSELIFWPVKIQTDKLQIKTSCLICKSFEG